ncbi:nucleotide exchange factor GrpE [Buchnera aphidicola]|uniref:nucleotide exchange factor GrpE n=1 Tax=Buchnera aphidicola TaxID=9 RepID=UPI0031B80041
MQNDIKNNTIKKIEKLKNQLKEIIKEKKEIKLRTEANIENIKKKSIDTIKNIKNNQLMEFLKKISHIINHFEKIFKKSQENNLTNHAVTKGIQLIQKSLLKTVQHFNKKNK